MRKRTQGNPQRPKAEPASGSEAPPDDNSSMPAQSISVSTGSGKAATTAASEALESTATSTTVSVVQTNPFWSEKAKVEAQLQASRPHDLPALEDAQDSSLQAPFGQPTIFGPGGTTSKVGSEDAVGEVEAAAVPDALELAPGRGRSAEGHAQPFPPTGGVPMMDPNIVTMLQNMIYNQNRQTSQLVPDKGNTKTQVSMLRQQRFNQFVNPCEQQRSIRSRHAKSLRTQQPTLPLPQLLRCINSIHGHTGFSANLISSRR